MLANNWKSKKIPIFWEVAIKTDFAQLDGIFVHIEQ